MLSGGVFILILMRKGSILIFHALNLVFIALITAKAKSFGLLKRLLIQHPEVSQLGNSCVLTQEFDHLMWSPG